MYEFVRGNWRFSSFKHFKSAYKINFDNSGVWTIIASRSHGLKKSRVKLELMNKLHVPLDDIYSVQLYYKVEIEIWMYDGHILIKDEVYVSSQDILATIEFKSSEE